MCSSANPENRLEREDSNPPILWAAVLRLSRILAIARRRGGDRAGALFSEGVPRNVSCGVLALADGQVCANLLTECSCVPEEARLLFNRSPSSQWKNAKPKRPLGSWMTHLAQRVETLRPPVASNIATAQARPRATKGKFGVHSSIT